MSSDLLRKSTNVNLFLIKISGPFSAMEEKRFRTKIVRVNFFQFSMYISAHAQKKIAFFWKHPQIEGRRRLSKTSRKGCRWLSKISRDKYLECHWYIKLHRSEPGKRSKILANTDVPIFLFVCAWIIFERVVLYSFLEIVWFLSFFLAYQTLWVI